MAELLRSFRQRVVAFHTQNSAQDLIEYALLAALISTISVAAMRPIAHALNNSSSSINSKLKNHVDKGLHKGWDR